MVMKYVQNHFEQQDCFGLYIDLSILEKEKIVFVNYASLSSSLVFTVVSHTSIDHMNT